MRCGRAQALMTAAVDGELTPRERTWLDQHMAGCPACHREMAGTGALLSAIDALPREMAVPAGLEAATLRRVRAMNDEAAAPSRRWWLVRPMPTFALAAAVVLALSVGLLRRASETGPAVTGRDPGAARVARAPVPERTAPVAVARNQPDRAPVGEPPADPPPALAAAPDLFVDLAILRNLEKLQHFEAIRMTTVDAPPAADGHGDENG